MFVVDVIAKDMHLTGALPLGAQFHAGYHAHPSLLPPFQSRGDAPNRVVVSYSDGLEALVRR